MGDMSEMIDRVAKAICDAENGIWNSLIGDWHTRISREKYSAMARAAIEAMREPTVAMEDAPYEASLDIYWSYNADGRPGSSEDVWRIMVDAALKEPV